MKFTKTLLAVAAMLTLASCSTFASSESDPQTLNLTEADNQYAFATYTGIRMLKDTASIAPAPLRADDGDTSGDEITDEDGDVELALVNKYLTLYKELTEEGVLDVELAAASDRPEYIFQITITTTGIDKVETTFVLYFNEIIIEDEEDIDDDIDGEDITTSEDTSEEVTSGEGLASRSRHGDRDERDSTLLEGIAVIGEDEYEVKGYRWVEEDATRVGFRARLDDGRSVHISQMSSDSAQRFAYVVRDGRHIIAEKKVLVATEENRTVLKLEDFADGVYQKYSFRREATADGDYYKIKYVTPEERGVVHIYITLDELGAEVLEYYFSNGHTYYHDGEGNHHGEHHHGQGGNGEGHGSPDGDDEDYEEEFSDFDF